MYHNGSKVLPESSYNTLFHFYTDGFLVIPFNPEQHSFVALSRLQIPLLWSNENATNDSFT